MKEVDLIANLVPLHEIARLISRSLMGRSSSASSRMRREAERERIPSEMDWGCGPHYAPPAHRSGPTLFLDYLNQFDQIMVNWLAPETKKDARAWSRLDEEVGPFMGCLMLTPDTAARSA